MKNNRFIIVSFLLIIYIVFLFYPIKIVMIKFGLTKVNTTDNYTNFVPKKENNIINKVENKINSKKNSLENKVNNYFPLFTEINSLYQNFNYKTNVLLYENVPIRKNSDNEYVFYNKKDGFYYLENKYTKKELDERVNKQIDFFNTLSEKVDLYIYIPSRYELTSFKDNNLYEYISIFEKGIKNAKVSHMNINNAEEYKELFYLTDHHWNINGAIRGYEDVMKMLNVPYINDFNYISNKERKYYGSMAKNAMSDIKYDYILDIDANLEYDVLINNKKADELFKPRKIRLDRDYKYYDYYVQYFNGQYGNIIYDYHDDSKDNLLILSDSFIWQIDYLIASSFNKTHVINLRYDEYENKNFDLTKYVKDNNIKKVLFLYEGESILFDQYDYDFVGRVK